MTQQRSDIAGNQNARPEPEEKLARRGADEAPVPAPVWRPCSERPRVAGVYAVKSRNFVPPADYRLTRSFFENGRWLLPQLNDRPLDYEWLDPQVNAAGIWPKAGPKCNCGGENDYGQHGVACNISRAWKDQWELGQTAPSAAAKPIGNCAEDVPELDSHPIRDKFGLKWPATPTLRKVLPAPPITAWRIWG